MVLLLTLLHVFCIAEVLSCSPTMSFDGEEHWTADELDQCEMHGTEYSPNLCYAHMINYQRLNVEVLFEDPILVVFRNFASQKDVAQFLLDAKKEELSLQEVVEMNETSTTYFVSNDRLANGTFISHEGTAAISKVFKKAKAMIPFVNFEYSEDWQILSYLPGGHYRPHHDYFEYESETPLDDYTKIHGNRFATFLLVLQNAEKGGGTVFPYLRQTVLASPGDVIFWTNMRSNKELDKNSYHGACVVRKGEKVAAVLWVREKFQDLLLYPHNAGGFDFDKLINPRLKLLQGFPICK
ncbi:unnamed protein product [Heligmosomoides polygyrus]|uniref:Fe2OG dioxygenase domain-containing protein n=1 Tax=Heligmosomoides polygyrus TaxID=6339 RepID=A0A3P8BW72_HELPZ|nr:unnamed protein product [Heligmosomoides polygyrus]